MIGKREQPAKQNEPTHHTVAVWCSSASRTIRTRGGGKRTRGRGGRGKEEDKNMSAPNNNPAQPRNANGVVLPAQSQATTSAPHAQAAVPNPTTQGSTTQAVRPKSTLPTSPFTPLTLFSLTHSLTHTHTRTRAHQTMHKP